MFPPRPLPPYQDLLTAQQVARRLAISTRTLWRLLARGSVPSPVRYNRKLVRWRTADIEHYVEKLTPGSLSEPRSCG